MPIKQLFVFFLFLTFASASGIYDSSKCELLNRDNSYSIERNAINIVIVGSGFNSTNSFLTEMRDVVGDDRSGTVSLSDLSVEGDELMDFLPFSTDATRLNIFAVKEARNRLCSLTSVTTNIKRLSCNTHKQRIESLAAGCLNQQSFRSRNRNFIVVIDSTPDFSRRGLFSSVSSGANQFIVPFADENNMVLTNHKSESHYENFRRSHPNRKYVPTARWVAHELGHTMFKLEDESGDLSRVGNNCVSRETGNSCEVWNDLYQLQADEGILDPEHRIEEVTCNRRGYAISGVRGCGTNFKSGETNIMDDIVGREGASGFGDVNLRFSCCFYLSSANHTVQNLPNYCARYSRNSSLKDLRAYCRDNYRLSR